MVYFDVSQQLFLKSINSSCCMNSGVTNHAMTFNTKGAIFILEINYE